MESLQHTRYTRLVHRGTALLDAFDAGQLKQIGRIASSLPPRDFALLYPFSFADLHLCDHPALASAYSSLEEIGQCRVLDVSMELVKMGESTALLAASHQSGMTSLLALGRQCQDILARAYAYLDSPLLDAMVDRVSEPDLHALLSQSQEALKKGMNISRDFCLFAVPCSEEFFIETVFRFPLDARYDLDWGPQKDCFARFKPTYLRESNASSPR